MIYRYYLLSNIFLFFLLITVSSCEKFSGDQSVPAYLSIDSIYLTTDYFSQGSSSQKITDAWVTVDNEFIGAFELPARFPVLKSGKHQVSIYPGVKKNGISATRVSYNFYKPIIKEVTLALDSTTKIGVLKTTYQSSTLFPFKEDFDQVGITLDTINGSSAFLQMTTEGSPLTFEGNHSGMIVLDSLHDYFECENHETIAIPSATVYLEMNFNTTNTVVLGVITYGSSVLYQTPIITLQTTNGAWKKIYIDLTTTLNAYSGMSTFRVYLRALKDTGMKQSTILIDNLKVVTRSGK
jgi:hypothetical protein